MTDKKQLKKKILEKLLKAMAIIVLKKYSPKIIAITGSVGKTSAKEAIFYVLASHFRTRKNEKNYNNEIGLPLTVIGIESGERSFFRWFLVFLKWLGIIIFPVRYPEILVLEMGADRPGDISYLTSFIRPEISVITEISESHIEFFKTVDNIAKEKWKIVKGMKERGLAVLNIDNIHILKLKSQNKLDGARALTFGFSAEAEVRAADVIYNYADNGSKNGREIRGISFKLNYRGTSLPVRLNNILAKHNIYAALAAAACGIEFKLNLVEIGAALENFTLPFGRMTLISGIKNSNIIDDSYNASPVSSCAALEVLGEIEAPRRIAVLGDMLELGENTEAGHRQVAKKFLDIRADIFLGVGKRMKFVFEELQKHNISPHRIIYFSNPKDAGKKLQEIIRENDLILVKGSQGMRMEKIVEEIMAEPQKARELLCRQTDRWISIPWKEV